MRWRIELSYLGTNFCGWQKQPGDTTVQQTLEEAFSKILRDPIEVIGCGRTDTGVHAKKYIAHFDSDALPDIEKLLYQVNSVLPNDIALHSIQRSIDDFHARYDAIERGYRYYMHFQKNPFLQQTSFFFNHYTPLDKIAMQSAAAILLNYESFLPFCKTGSDNHHFRCKLTVSEWSFTENDAVYTIKANRFLRGMVRLITGACLNAGLGKLSLDEIISSLENQTPLPIQWSVPPEGLFLESILYETQKS